MIAMQKGIFAVECDGCTEVLDTGTSYFPAAVEYLAEQRWRATKMAGKNLGAEVWKHYCPECR